MTAVQLVKIFPALYENRKSIIVFTNSRHWFQSSAKWIQSHTLFKIYINIILPSTPASSRWSQPFWDFVCISHLRYACYMSPLGTNTLSTLFKTPIYILPSGWETKFHACIKQQTNSHRVSTTVSNRVLNYLLLVRKSPFYRRMKHQ